MKPDVTGRAPAGVPAAAFCSTREAAQLLGVAVRTVQLWVEAGALHAWKTAGGHRRITRASVEAMLGERERALRGAARVPAATRSRGPGRVLRVLVVEDEPALLKLYRLQIARWRLPVALETAGSGFEALIAIGRAPPDLLVTDLNMPGMDGFRMLRELSEDERLAGVLVLVVTALSREEIDDRGGVPRGVAVFTKPIPFSELERRATERARELGLPSA